jgi:DNA-binding NarL/FixJ family response regulator
MHQPLARHGHVVAAAPRSVLFLVANPLDCELLTLWCKTRLNCERVDGVATLSDGLELCQTQRPGLVVLDPSTDDVAIENAISALRDKLMHYLLVLDRLPLVARLLEILAEPRASYLSRVAGHHALAAAIDEILKNGRRVFDPSLASCIRQTERGYSFEQRPADGSIASLSTRERQVMRLLAMGRSVQQCATELGLSHSTIDNHKARLMKKLDIHKASELTFRAIRDGLIVF